MATETEDETERTAEQKPQGGWKSLVPWFVLVFGAGLLAGWGIGRSGAAGGPPDFADVPPTPVLEIGQKATSQRGNTVTVHSIKAKAPRETPASPGRRYLTADVEWCAGPGESMGILFMAQRWSVEDEEARRWTSDKNVSGENELLAQPPTIIAEGECARGEIVFQLPTDRRPAFVIFSGAQPFKWRIPDTFPWPIEPTPTVVPGTN